MGNVAIQGVSVQIALILQLILSICVVISSTQLFLLNTFKALNGHWMCWCAVKKLLTHSLT